VVAGITPAKAESIASGLSVIQTQITKGRAAKTGYTRDQFGPAWADVDRNGCDTRNDILKRDLVSEVFKEKTNGCTVLTGTLVDPFSGETINFVQGAKTSSEVQIDHVVALSNAWQTGAFKLTADQRKAFANDPLNLLAVKGRLNSQKGDGDAATWLPPLKSFRCDYVSKQIAVKIKYKLWFTAPEKEAMIRILKTCPEKALPIETLVVAWDPMSFKYSSNCLLEQDIQRFFRTIMHVRKNL
jgi:hypothetical protein